MNMGECRTEFDVLRGQAKKMDHAADQVSEVIKRLKSDVDSRGTAPWGDDEPGGLFGEGYTTAAEKIYYSLGQAQASLTDLALGIRRAADKLREREEANRGLIDGCVVPNPPGLGGNGGQGYGGTDGQPRRNGDGDQSVPDTPSRLA